MEKEDFFIRLEIDMKENGEKIRKKEKAYIIGKEEINLKDILKIIRGVNMVNIIIITVKDMKVN